MDESDSPLPPRIRPLVLLFLLLLVKLGLAMRGVAFALKPKVRVGLLVFVSPRFSSTFCRKLLLANQKGLVFAVVLPLWSLIRSSPHPPPPPTPNNGNGIRDPIKRAGLLQWLSHLSCDFVCPRDSCYWCCWGLFMVLLFWFSHCYGPWYCSISWPGPSVPPQLFFCQLLGWTWGTFSDGRI